MVLVLPLRGMGALAVQIPDLIFLLALPFVLWHYRKKLFAVGPLLWVGVLYVGANVLSAAMSGSTSALVESAARGYLLLLGFWMAAWVREGTVDTLWPRICTVITGVGIVWASVSLLLYASHLIWGHGLGVNSYTDYPYFGDVVRLNGGTMTSNLFLWAIGPAFFLLFEARLAGRKGGNFVFLVGLAVLLTLSKAMLLYLSYVVMRLIERYCAFHRPLLARSVIIGTTLFLYLGTHVVWDSSPSPPTKDNVFIVEDPFYSSSLGDFYLTSYSSIKMANLHLFQDHPWFGVGPGQSRSYISGLVDQGIYPENLPKNEPHSSILGAASETGIFGLLSLLFLMGYSVYTFLPLAQSADPTLRALVYFLLFLLISSFQQDIMNFRFLWVIWGLVLGVSR